MKTKQLDKSQYKSPYHYDSQEYIKKLVQKDEVYVETVVDLCGRAGNPIYQPCEVVFE